MGKNYRDGRYNRRVSLGKRTVKDGEAVAIWDRRGRHTQIIGPRLVYLFYSTIRFLDRFVAHHDEYLVIEGHDGVIKHSIGPCNMWFDPVEYRSIKVNKAIPLESSNECVVVSDLSDKSLRKVITGPKTFFPQPNEVVHRFPWLAMPDDTVTISTNRSDVLKLNNVQFIIQVSMANEAQGKFCIQFSIQDPLLLVDSVENLYLEFENKFKADLLDGGTVEELLALGPVSNKTSNMEETKALMPNSNLKSCLPHLTAACDAMRITLHAVTAISMRPSVAAKRAADAHDELITAENTARMKLRIAEIELDGEKKRADQKNEVAVYQLQSQMALTKTKFDAERALRIQVTSDVLELLEKLKSIGVDVSRLVCETAKGGGGGGKSSENQLISILNAISEKFVGHPQESQVD